MMKIVRNWKDFPKRVSTSGTVVLIGTFDGLHIGHQALIKMAKAEAIKSGLPLILMTFEPSPKNYFLKKAQGQLNRLLSFYDRAKLLEQMGVEYLVILKFNVALIKLSPEDFLNTLRLSINPKSYYLGQDFKFGQHQTGNIFTIEQYAEQHDQKIHVLPIIKDADTDLKISSTSLRTSLAEGNLAVVNRLLVRPYRISGKVCPGKKLGRTIGVRTANINLKHFPVPLRGVYAVKICKIGSALVDYSGVANIGIRPTVHQDSRLVLEVHIFDQALELYGKRIEIEFVQKIRDEKKFPSLEALKTQINEDSKKAKLIV